MVRLVKVRPFLVPVVNGDLFYAGPAYNDASTSFMCATDTITYHVYFVKGECSLPDGIHHLPDFKPRFLQPQSTNQDDLDTVMDAVCIKSFAVEEGSAEAFAAPRRSNEPELGSPAASTQQADRVICTEKSAHSSRKQESSRESTHGFS